MGALPVVDSAGLVDALEWFRAPILIGAGGSRLKAIGTAARPQIERLLGTRVHLDLHVAVESAWQRDPRKLGRLGL